MNGRPRSLEGEYRSGHQHGHDGGSDQDPSRQRNVTTGHRRRCDGGDLTGRQTNGGDAVAEGSGRDQVGDQPGKCRKDAGADGQGEAELRHEAVSRRRDCGSMPIAVENTRTTRRISMPWWCTTRTSGPWTVSPRTAATATTASSRYSAQHFAAPPGHRGILSPLRRAERSGSLLPGCFDRRSLLSAFRAGFASKARPPCTIDGLFTGNWYSCPSPGC